jgi:hypothetical protein
MTYGSGRHPDPDAVNWPSHGVNVVVLIDALFTVGVVWSLDSWRKILGAVLAIPMLIATAILSVFAGSWIDGTNFARGTASRVVGEPPAVDGPDEMMTDDHAIHLAVGFGFVYVSRGEDPWPRLVAMCMRGMLSTRNVNGPPRVITFSPA